MPLQDLGLLDFIFVSLDSIAIILAALIFINQGTSFGKCRNIIIEKRHLFWYRIFLYGQISSSLLAAVFTFIIPSTIKILFHVVFVISTIYMLAISLPKWTCKKMGQSGTCACDMYEYHDFLPMEAVGIIGTLILIIFNFTAVESLYILIPIFILSVIIFQFLPKKKIKPLKYPQELLIQTIDQYQEFLMSTPGEKKLITMVKPTCDFCTMQINELDQVPFEILAKRLRIFDLGFKDTIDPVLPLILNITDFSKVPVPSTRVYDSGMEIELFEGILTTSEIRELLD